MQIAWATDVHFDAAEPEDFDEFCTQVRRTPARALLLGGDIATGGTTEEYLREMERLIHLPVYFVLGNHDYYGSSIAAVHESMGALEIENVWWLRGPGVFPLSASTALVGHGGWADATLGDFARAPLMTDFFSIEELFQCIGVEDLLDGFKERERLQARLQELGREAGEALRPSLAEAAASFQHVIVLTHVPPFREAAWYGGVVSPDDWLPNVTCHAMGRVIRQLARAHPDVRFTVLCGHTHGEGKALIEPNLEVTTRAATYSKPDFVVLEID
jgi:predicted phosphohydrolase